MKIIMVLGIIIGFLLCSLFFIFNRYSSGNTSSSHIQIIEKNSLDVVKTYCHKNIEYIIINGNGTSITTAIDHNNQPLKCNY
ncbi:MAG: hypothetical protein KBD37_08695 [Burkholderiales bacterium]|nr:hypothetical protein [Burkholderiales bacterium]